MDAEPRATPSEVEVGINKPTQILGLPIDGLTNIAAIVSGMSHLTKLGVVSSETGRQAENAAHTLSQLPGLLDRLGGIVDHVGGFEDPQAQFVSEVDTIVGRVYQNANRAAGRVDATISHPILTRNHLARGIQETMKGLIVESGRPSPIVPLLAPLIKWTTTEGLPKGQELYQLPSIGTLEVAGPDIMEALQSILPPDEEREMAQRNWRGPRHIRTTLAGIYAGSEIEDFRKLTPNLVKGIRDTLPKNGPAFQANFSQFRRAAFQSR